MFTGIIECVGTLESLRHEGSLARLEIRAPEATEGVREGDSVAVNGACLTVTAVTRETLGFDAILETLERTSLGALRPGDRVNLERALRAGARLDGHIVQGHVDGVGHVQECVQMLLTPNTECLGPLCNGVNSSGYSYPVMMACLIA